MDRVPAQGGLDERVCSNLRLIARVFAAVVCLEGCIVILARAFDIALLSSILPAWVPMKASSAACFILAGLAMWLQTGRSVAARGSDTTKAYSPICRPSRLITLACGFVVALVGLGTLSEHLFGWDLGIDPLPVAETPADVPASIAGRMARTSALNFLLVGVALLLFDARTRRGHRPAQYVILPVLVMALWSSLLSVFGATRLEGATGYPLMASHTAVAFLLTSAGLLFARPEFGFMRTIASAGAGGSIARWLLAGLFMVLPLAGWLHLEGAQRKLYGPEMGATLMVALMIALLAPLTLVVARAVNRKDAAQESAEESARQLAAIVESCHDAVIGKKLDGTIISWNPGARAVYGYTAEEVIGRRMSILIPEELGSEVTRFVQEIRRGGKIDHYEIVHLRKDGKRINVSIRMSPIKDASGKILGVSTIARDITEQKRLENEHNRLFDLSLDMLCIAGFDGYLKELNLAWQRTLGWAYHELKAGPFIELVHPDDRKATADEMESLARGQTRPMFRNRYRCKDGSYKWISWNPYPLLEENLIFAVGRDVTAEIGAEQALQKARDELETRVKERTAELTKANKALQGQIVERRRAEESLSDSEERYRTLFETSPDAIVVLDVKGNIVVANQRCVTQGRYDSVSEMVGRSVHDLVAPQDWKRSQELIETLLQNGQIKDAELLALRKDGSNFPAQLSAALVRDFTGKPTHITAVFQDITERKWAIEQVRLSYERVKKSLKDITGALAYVVEKRDPYTAGHQLRVSNVAAEIAKGMGLSEEDVAAIRMAGILHDIGKIGVPAEILSRPGKLGGHEVGVVRDHVEVGYEILKDIEFEGPVADIVRQHHERMDGSGYPNGLSGRSILRGARILAVADVVEGMASHRPYRPALGLDKALDEITRNRGVLYDPDVVDVCVKIVTEKGFSFD